MPTVAIVGGGSAGTLAALKLASMAKQFPSLDVLLIDAKEYFEYTPGIVNVAVQSSPGQVESRFRGVSRRYEDVLKGTRVLFVKGHVDHIATEGVHLSDGRVLLYDYLILCTGSSYPRPFKLDIRPSVQGTIAERLEALRQERATMEQAKRILCIGGGPVGVELVGELVRCWPDKQVTLVSARPQLLARCPSPKVGQAAHAALQQWGVNVILNEKACPDDHVTGSSFVYRTTSGQTIEADQVYLCTGITPNSGIMRQHFADCLDDRGFVCVDTFFRLRVHDDSASPTRQLPDNIFCIGDVNDIPEEKMTLTAHMQAMHLVQNLAQLLRDSGGKPDALTPYHGTRISMFVSLGPTRALGYTQGIALTGLWGSGSWAASAMKWSIQYMTMASSVKGPFNSAIYATQTNPSLLPYRPAPASD